MRGRERLRPLTSSVSPLREQIAKQLDDQLPSPLKTQKSPTAIETDETFTVHSVESKPHSILSYLDDIEASVGVSIDFSRQPTRKTVSIAESIPSVKPVPLSENASGGSFGDIKAKLLSLKSQLDDKVCFGFVYIPSLLTGGCYSNASGIR